MDKKYVRSRIDELRIKKNVSEYKMGLDLGKSQGYIQTITSGRTMPSMGAFFDLCAYFEIEPAEFFDPKIKNPSLIHDVINIIKEMPESDIKLFLSLLKRYQELNSPQSS